MDEEIDAKIELCTTLLTNGRIRTWILTGMWEDEQSRLASSVWPLLLEWRSPLLWSCFRAPPVRGGRVQPGSFQSLCAPSARRPHGSSHVLWVSRVSSCLGALLRLLWGPSLPSWFLIKCQGASMKPPPCVFFFLINLFIFGCVGSSFLCEGFP